MKLKFLLFWLIPLHLFCFSFPTQAQKSGAIIWLKSGDAFVQEEEGNIVKFTLPARKKQIILAKEKLITAGQIAPLAIRSFSFSSDEQKLLLFTNTRKVWRLHTRGDYLV